MLASASLQIELNLRSRMTPSLGRFLVRVELNYMWQQHDNLDSPSAAYGIQNVFQEAISLLLPLGTLEKASI